MILAQTAPKRYPRRDPFHFATAGIHETLRQARDAAAGKDVRLGGGVSTVRQYLQARLIDELHLAYSPVFLGAGESLFRDIDINRLGYEVTERASTLNATHVVLAKTGVKSDRR